MQGLLCRGLGIDWVAVKEFNSSYSIRGTIFIFIYVHCGKFI